MSIKHGYDGSETSLIAEKASTCYRVIYTFVSTLDEEHRVLDPLFVSEQLARGSRPACI
jgi:hypothetical protein